MRTSDAESSDTELWRSSRRSTPRMGVVLRGDREPEAVRELACDVGPGPARPLAGTPRRMSHHCGWQLRWGVRRGV